MLQRTLRDAQLAGHDIGAVIDRITAGPMDGARSIASVLHGRLQRLHLHAQGHGVTWAQRTPDSASALAHELAAGLEALRKDTFRALEIADEHAEIRATSRGELEAQVLEADRAQATAPPDTSSLLRLTAQAETDAWQQSADAAAQHDQVRAENARSLAAAPA